MRRGGGGEAVGFGVDRHAGEARDDFAVAFLFEPRLDRFPIGSARRLRQSGGKDGFSDAGAGAGDDEAGHAAAIACASASAIASMLSSLTLSVIAMRRRAVPSRSEEHTSELQSLMRISYAVFCLTKK